MTAYTNTAETYHTAKITRAMNTIMRTNARAPSTPAIMATTSISSSSVSRFKTVHKHQRREGGREGGGRGEGRREGK